MKILLAVYDRDGGVIGNEFTYADINTLRANQKSTFKFFTDSDTFKGMDHYELSLEWDNEDGTNGYVENAQIYEDPAEAQERQQRQLEREQEQQQDEDEQKQDEEDNN